MTAHAHQHIVVGVDGSSHAQAALRFAVAEARLRGATVEAVMAWHLPYYGGVAGMPLPLDSEAIERSYRAELDRAVERVDTGGMATPIERRLVEGTPAGVLLDASTGASLLVVGSRGRGGFVGLLLGSVSHQVAAHAHCPVVIVPPTDDAA
jgi:nucleotide-binding universal stress UspA family protein